MTTHFSKFPVCDGQLQYSTLSTVCKLKMLSFVSVYVVWPEGNGCRCWLGDELYIIHQDDFEEKDE